MCRNLENLLAYKSPRPLDDIMSAARLSKNKFFSSVPAFRVGRAGAAGSHAIIEGDDMEDDGDMSILRSRLDEVNHLNVILQQQSDDEHIG